MPDDEVLNQEDPLVEDPGDPESPAEIQGSEKVRKSFSKLAVELDEEDLSSKGVQKLLLSEITRLEVENSELQKFRKDFHDRDKDCAKYKVLLRKNTMLEILYSIAITGAAALLGVTFSVSEIWLKITLSVIALSLFTFALLAKWRGAKDES